MPEPKPNPKQSVTYTKLFIDNEWVDSVSGKKFATINPATEEKIAEISEGDKADIDKAVVAARKAFARGSAWRKLDASARADLLNKFANAIEENVNELANLESIDTGKPFTSTVQEVYATASILRKCASWADKIRGNTLPASGNSVCMTRKEPVGVVGQIIPWNAPIVMVAVKLGPALATGCTVVLKPAELTPLTALRVASFIKEVGFPPGVINIVPGFGETAGAAISEHPDINKISFTGSCEVGRLIMQSAGKHNLKRVSLELGGKSPLVVFDDADLDSAAQVAHNSLFRNAGQICIAPSRVFVQSGVYDEFVKKSVALAVARKVGDPFDPTTQTGPQIDKGALDKILGLIESGKKEGAKLQTGGARLGKIGYFIESTVFSDVTDDMRIAKEEIFGPVQSIFKFDTLEEVIKRANATTYGLAAGVFTKNLDVALEFSNAVEAGLVGINQWGGSGLQAPFGGYKHSGLGREMGEEGMDSYLEIKTISISLPTNH